MATLSLLMVLSNWYFSKDSLSRTGTVVSGIGSFKAGSPEVPEGGVASAPCSGAGVEDEGAEGAVGAGADSDAPAEEDSPASGAGAVMAAEAEAEAEASAAVATSDDDAMASGTSQLAELIVLVDYLCLFVRRRWCRTG